MNIDLKGFDKLARKNKRVSKYSFLYSDLELVKKILDTKLDNTNYDVIVEYLEEQTKLKLNEQSLKNHLKEIVAQNKELSKYKKMFRTKRKSK